MTDDDATARARAWLEEDIRVTEYVPDDVASLATLLAAVAREERIAALDEAAKADDVPLAFQLWLRRRAAALREAE